MTPEPCTPEHIRYVVHNSWERGRKEAELCGFKTEEAWVAHIQSMTGEYGYTALHEGVPVAIYGAVEKNGTYYTFFAATESFNAIARQITRFLRRFLIEKLAEKPGARLELGSLCDHPKADDWFKALGFKLIKRDGLLGHYVYQHN